jgi:hypothetical protein
MHEQPLSEAGHCQFQVTRYKALAAKTKDEGERRSLLAQVDYWQGQLSAIESELRVVA